MLPVELLLLFSLGATQSLAQQITYYSDVPLYSSLVICAAAVCDANLEYIAACGPNSSPVGPYASCACLKQQNSASITASIKSLFKANICGATPTDDISSVLAVFSSWCAAVAPNQAAVTVTSSTMSNEITASPGSALISASTPTSANSPTSVNASSGTASSTGTNLSIGAIIGIVAGTSLLVVAILTTIYVVRRWGRRRKTDPPYQLQRPDGLGKYGSSGGVPVVINNNFDPQSGAENRDSTVPKPVPGGYGNVTAAGLIRSHR